MANDYVKTVQKGSTTYDIHDARINDVSTLATQTDLAGKQDALVSGTNIKTINNESILGPGNINISGGGGSAPYELQDFQLDLTEEEFECSDADAEYIFTNNPVAISLGGTIAVARDFTDDESKSDYSRSYTLAEFPDDDQIIYYELGLYWDGSEYSSDVKPTDPIGGGGSGSEVSGTNDGTNWTTITIDGTTKAIPSGGSAGTAVVANPTLAGGEDALESIQIGSTKYGIESIYPTDVSIEQISAVSHDVTTTVYGDMSGTLTDTDEYMETPNKVTTWWLTQIPEAPIQGKRLKAISLATKAGGTLTIRGSNQTPGYPNESKSDLANKAIANNAAAFTICTINTVSGFATYLLNGTDARVTIVSQQYIDSCPNSVGVYEQAGSDSAIIYFPKTQDYTDGFVTYWYNGAQAMTRPIGVNFTYEVIDTPAETDLVFELSNGDDISCSLDNVPIITQSLSPLKDKKIAFVGDSISMNTMTTYAYYDYLQNMTGCIPIGMGVGGSTITNVVDRSPMCTRVLDVPLVADAVCVLGGTNDFGLSSPLGQQYTVDGNNVRTLNTDTSTFWGALNTMCINLHSRFTTKQIFLMTPIHRGVFKNLSTLTDFTQNSDGHYLEDYVDAIKEACKCFSFTCIDLYNTAGLYPHDSTNGTTYYLANTNSGDYLHPNDAGYQRIAKVIKMALENSIIV